eukprot:8017204-Pyramimonas_sp.AAC.3
MPSCFTGRRQRSGAFTLNPKNPEPWIPGVGVVCEKAPCLVSLNFLCFHRWDRIIADGDADFSQRMHMIICQNCNHHVAKCLNLMEYCGMQPCRPIVKYAHDPAAAVCSLE